jgi:hypothetical protein
VRDEQANCFACVENRKAERYFTFREIASWGRVLFERR